jgi:hypothetical protein
LIFQINFSSLLKISSYTTMTTKNSNLKDKSKSKAHSQDSIPSFIRKTYDILEERKFPEVIDWNPEGTALVIKKPSEFCQKVLPTYFKHNNLTSFVRQLNMYNFHKRRTQNIDHVYYHELFQRGKKQLLKEIKRKNHEHNVEKTPKGSEVLEATQGNQDVNSLMYENQILKRLYNDAMTKVNMYETQIKELSVQNQNLWSQICQKGETISKPFPDLHEKQTELTQEQLPMTLGEIYIPPLKLSNNDQTMPVDVPMAKNISSYLNLARDDSGESTEASHNSPSRQPNMESDKGFDLTEPTPSTYPQETINESFNLPILTLTPQVSNLPQFKAMKSTNELFATRQEMSIGTLFATWNQEAHNNVSEGMGFGETKVDKAYIDTQSMFQEPTSVLGKRQLEQVNTEAQLHMHEPLSKRCELSVFSKRGLISTGTEEKEMFRVMKMDSAVNEEYDMGVDLMDFNPVFTTWTKTA